jgi:hypothetical protein
LRYLLERGGSAFFPLRAIHSHLANGDFHLIAKGPEMSVPVYLSRSPMAHVEDWFDDAVQSLASFASRHNDMVLDTIPFEEWGGLAPPA